MIIITFIYNKQEYILLFINLINACTTLAFYLGFAFYNICALKRWILEIKYIYTLLDDKFCS